MTRRRYGRKLDRGDGEPEHYVHYSHFSCCSSDLTRPDCASQRPRNMWEMGADWPRGTQAFDNRGLRDPQRFRPERGVEPNTPARYEWGRCSSPANHDEQHGSGHQHDLYQCEPLLYKHISQANYPFRKNGPKAGSALGHSLLLSAGGLSGRAVSRRDLKFRFHRARHAESDESEQGRSLL
jgi:hypothetical protein